MSALVLVLGLLLASEDVAWGQLENPANDVTVEEHLGQTVSLDRKFQDSKGNEVTLGSLARQGKPMIVSMNYSRCPKLCDLQLGGLVSALKETKLEPGEDFLLVSVSFDPRETTTRAHEAKQKYVEQFGRSSAQRGFYFLTGPSPSIKSVASSLGIVYSYVKYRDEYLHPAVFCVVSPKGKITRYLYGITFDDPQTLRMALVEGSEGKVGTTLERVLLLCTAFNPTSGKYTASVMKIMKLGGAAFVILLLLGLIPFWMRDRLKSATPTGS